MKNNHFKYMFCAFIFLFCFMFGTNSVSAEDIVIEQNECMFYTGGAYKNMWVCKEQKTCIKTCYGTCAQNAHVYNMYLCKGDKKLEVVVKNSAGVTLTDAQISGGSDMLDDVKSYTASEKEITVKQGECMWFTAGNVKNWVCKSESLCNDTCTKLCVVRPQYKDVYTCPGTKKGNVTIVDANGNVISDDDVTGSWDGLEEVEGKKTRFFDNWDSIPAAINGITDIMGTSASEFDCEGSMGEVLVYVQWVFNAIKLIAVVLLVLLSGLEFVKAVGASNEDALKVATQKFGKRAVITIAIIILPSLVNLILKIAALSGGTCGIS